jgi:hydrogenase/urease accessory protein HupE
MMKRAGRLVFIAGVITFFPSSAEAHLVSSGMGPFYDGVTHLFLSLDDVLGVIALALFAGLHGKARGRATLVALPAAWILGGLAGLQNATEIAAPAASAVSILAVGALLAANAPVPSAAFLVLAAAFGAFHGFLNGTTAAAGMGLTGLAGIALAVFILAALLASFAVGLEKQWLRIAVRVAGSWIAAFGLLMIGWTLRP